MLRFFLIFFFIIIITNSNADIKNKIIQNLRETKNLNFKFEQSINGKAENGNCTVEYPKKSPLFSPCNLLPIREK